MLVCFDLQVFPWNVFCADKCSANSARDMHWTVRVLHMMFCYPILINTGIHRNLSESSGSYLSLWVYRHSIFMFVPLSSTVHDLLFVFENIANQNAAEERFFCTSALVFLCHCSWFNRTKIQYCRKFAGSIPDGVIGIFPWHNPSGSTMALGLTQPVTGMSARNISWV
jgi:hypothetical protein